MRRLTILFTLLICASAVAKSQTNTFHGHGEGIATRRCVGSQLSARHESEDAGVGQRYVTYSFKNRASSPCTLSGFPGFVLLNRRGRPIRGQSITHSAEQVTVVRLAPGGKAFFHIHYSACSTVGTPPCRTSSKVRITAPRTTRSFTLPEVMDPYQLEVDLSPVRKTAEP